jgi:hypothetical protein
MAVKSKRSVSILKRSAKIKKRSESIKKKSASIKKRSATKKKRSARIAKSPKKRNSSAASHSLFVGPQQKITIVLIPKKNNSKTKNES